MKHLLSICDRFAPGTSDLVVDAMALPPPDDREALRHHPRPHPPRRQQFGFADRLPYATPIAGLYSASAGTHPAGQRHRLRRPQRRDAGAARPEVGGSAWAAAERGEPDADPRARARARVPAARPGRRRAARGRRRSLARAAPRRLPVRDLPLVRREACRSSGIRPIRGASCPSIAFTSAVRSGASWPTARTTSATTRRFERVIRACQKTPRPGQDGTWITEEMAQRVPRLARDGLRALDRGVARRRARRGALRRVARAPLLRGIDVRVEAQRLEGRARAAGRARRPLGIPAHRRAGAHPAHASPWAPRSGRARRSSRCSVASSPIRRAAAAGQPTSPRSSPRPTAEATRGRAAKREAQRENEEERESGRFRGWAQLSLLGSLSLLPSPCACGLLFVGAPCQPYASGARAHGTERAGLRLTRSLSRGHSETPMGEHAGELPRSVDDWRPRSCGPGGRAGRPDRRHGDAGRAARSALSSTSTTRPPRSSAGPPKS